MKYCGNKACKEEDDRDIARYCATCGSDEIYNSRTARVIGNWKKNKEESSSNSSIETDPQEVRWYNFFPNRLREFIPFLGFIPHADRIIDLTDALPKEDTGRIVKNELLYGALPLALYHTFFVPVIFDKIAKAGVMLEELLK